MDLPERAVGALPRQRLERDGIEVRVVPTENGRLDRESFKTAVSGADMVCFSALTWTHGTKLPVAELVDIAHDAGAFALVDAVQVPGQLPMNVSAWGADAVAAAGHKWLLGLWGGGFLYVNGDVADSLHPRTVGYRSVETPTADPFEYAEGARRFEVGPANPHHTWRSERQSTLSKMLASTVSSLASMRRHLDVHQRCPVSGYRVRKHPNQAS
nr:aminotransferase class V-fold PLP-dependent enzyme [Haloarcula sp. Atlit-47R]